MWRDHKWCLFQNFFVGLAKSLLSAQARTAKCTDNRIVHKIEECCSVKQRKKQILEHKNEFIKTNIWTIEVWTKDSLL